MSKYHLSNRLAAIRKGKKRKEQGLCRSCNNPLTKESIVYCEEHVKKNRKRSLIYGKSERRRKLKEKRGLKTRHAKKKFFKMMENLPYSNKTKKAIIMDGTLLDKRMEELKNDDKML